MGADRAGLDRAVTHSVPIGHSNVVVVGVDGSQFSLRAVRWAAEEAVRRGAELRLVHAELPLPTGVPDVSKLARSALHDEAMGWMQDAAATAKETAPGLDVQTHVEVTTAAVLLGQESETAALVVVGARGRGGFAGLLLGSVAAALSSSSWCPVVIMRGEDPVPGRPVVVGVHGAPEDWLVLGRAFEEAAARATSLVAVHAWKPPFESAELAESVGIVWSGLDAVRQSLVAQRLASCADRHPGVRVECHVVHGSAAKQLVELSQDAALLVVGSHGCAGATSHAVVQYARCPVLLVRPGLSEQIEQAHRAV